MLGERSTQLGGSSKVISTLFGAIGIVTLMITLVTKSHDPLSTLNCHSQPLWSLKNGYLG